MKLKGKKERKKERKKKFYLMSKLDFQLHKVSTFLKQITSETDGYSLHYDNIITKISI